MRPAAAGTADDAHFDALHRSSDDPWGVFSRWYERRKRDLVLAALPRQHYGLGFEPGCSVGGNTRALAARCATLVACDASAAALTRAGAALADVPNLRLEHWTFPLRWPERPCDLVVVAELAYYLSASDFQDFMTGVRARLAPGGHLLLCHWRAPIADALRGGDAVHEQARRQLALDHVGGWCDEDMRIDVWQRGGSTSVAAAGGALERLRPASGGMA
ncbi:MAG: class I SAM-dependent methyltransferase [Pseudomonadota bacterium]